MVVEFPVAIVRQETYAGLVKLTRYLVSGLNFRSSVGRELGKIPPLSPRKEDKGSFLPQNLLVETQVLALPAGAPDEREQGDGGV